jgi:hypothetical protein
MGPGRNPMLLAKPQVKKGKTLVTLNGLIIYHEWDTWERGLSQSASVSQSCNFPLQLVEELSISAQSGLLLLRNSKKRIILAHSGQFLTHSARSRMTRLIFVPEQRLGWRTKVFAALLASCCCLGLGWWAWSSVQPHLRIVEIQQQFASASDAERMNMGRELIGLGEPGQRWLLQLLASEQPELQREAQQLWMEQLTIWYREPSLIPAHWDQLTIELQKIVQALPVERRAQLSRLIESWLDLPQDQTTVDAATAQAHWQARRELVNLLALRTVTPRIIIETETTEPLLSQENSTTNEDRTALRLIPESVIESKTPEPRYLSEEPSAQPLFNPATRPAEPAQLGPPLGVIRPLLPTNDSNPSSDENLLRQPHTANQPVRLSNAGQQTERIQVLPAEEEPAPIAASDWSLSDFLASAALAEYHMVDVQQQQQYLRLWRALPFSPTDRELLSLYTAGKPDAVLKAVNELPREQGVALQEWLRVFVKHPQSTVRRAAYGWLFTLGDQATLNWLQTVSAQESDQYLRDWLNENIRQAHSQQKRTKSDYKY